MIFTQRISQGELTRLCRRLAVATDAGLDTRRVWAREAESASPRMRPAMRDISQAVAEGHSISDALDRHAGQFPQLFRDLVEVGEVSGGMQEIYRQLADHYEFRLRMRRLFLGAIAWPAIQLIAAILIVGFLIWVMGIIGQRPGGEGIDPLGWGLVGNSGLLIYALLVTGLFVAGALAVRAVSRGMLWTRPLQNLAMRLPAVGGALRIMAEAHVARMLHLLMNVDLDVRKVVATALRSTRNDYYARHADQVIEDLNSGSMIHEAFRRTGAFRQEFVDALEVAETGGRIVESLGNLAASYEDQTRTATKVFAVVAGFAVWAMVAGILVLLIFRLALFYIGTIESLT
ncbi:MAG: type II secretion system F family protein [Pirellulales bacterium]